VHARVETLLVHGVLLSRPTSTLLLGRRASSACRRSRIVCRRIPVVLEDVVGIRPWRLLHPELRHRDRGLLDGRLLHGVAHVLSRHVHEVLLVAIAHLRLPVTVLSVLIVGRLLEWVFWHTRHAISRHLRHLLLLMLLLLLGGAIMGMRMSVVVIMVMILGLWLLVLLM